MNETVDFDPSWMLNTVIRMLQLKNDAALSRELEVAPPVLSKIRHGRIPVGPSLLIRLHEVSGISIQELRGLMGDRRERFRIGSRSFEPERGHESPPPAASESRSRSDRL